MLRLGAGEEVDISHVLQGGRLIGVERFPVPEDDVGKCQHGRHVDLPRYLNERNGKRFGDDHLVLHLIWGQRVDIEMKEAGKNVVGPSKDANAWSQLSDVERGPLRASSAAEFR